MNSKRLLIISSKILLVTLIGISELIYKAKGNSLKESKAPLQEYIRNIPDNKYYLLGTGDTLSLKVSEDAVDLNQVFTINGEGTAFLKRLKTVFIKGLTIQELQAILNKEYAKYVLNPDVELKILSYRPVTFYTFGELISPGLHVLPGSSSPFNSEDFEQNNMENQDQTINSNPNKNNVFFPSLIDALRKSGGITINADLTNIKITRINNISNGGGRISTNVDLIETFEFKDTSQNIRILDGDTITIERNKIPAIEQISKAIKSNINPKFISVLVSGRVEKPGQITINKSSTLNDAIKLAGGTKVIKGPVNFLRYNNDGSIDSRKFNYRAGNKRGSFKNPYLRNGDIVFIGKGNLAKTNELITDVTSPLQGIITSIGFYKLLVD